MASMRFLLCLFSILSLVCLLPSCKSAKEPKKDSKVTLIGFVEMVNPEQNYVLIRCEQLFALSAGTELTALDATGSVSKLRLTPERKGRYLTADIVSGQPRVMNLVMQEHTFEPTSAASLAAATGTAPVIPTEPLMPLTPQRPGGAVIPSLPTIDINSLSPASPNTPMPALPEPALELEPPLQ